MFRKPARGLFITGTDKDVGKTYVGTLIVRSLVAKGHRVGVYLPVAIDCVDDGHQAVSEGALALWQAANEPLTLADVCPQCFRASLAPHLSARAEGRSVNPNLLRKGLEIWADHADIVIVEGVGGLMSPVGDNEYIADLACDFGYPLIVVAPNMLGAINQTLQTLVTAAHYRGGLPVAGIVLTDIHYSADDRSVDTNPEEISRRAQPPVLARVGHEAHAFDVDVDWFALTERTQPIPADSILR
jgi:dethiobiotin synthetase